MEDMTFSDANTYRHFIRKRQRITADYFCIQFRKWRSFWRQGGKSWQLVKGLRFRLTAQ